MQINIYDYMVNDMKLSGAELLVYAAINAYMEHGFCNTTQNQIASATNLGLRTVTRCVANLKAKKIIDITKYWDGGQRRNCYTIKQDLSDINQCSNLDTVIQLWHECIGVEVNKSLEVYKLYSAQAAKNKNYFSELMEAIGTYGAILDDVNYYKSYICSFKKFLDGKYKDYIKDGSEDKEYRCFLSKNYKI